MTDECKPKKPLIFLLGFLNSKRYYFEKLIEMYEQIGCEVVFNTPVMYDEYFYENSEDGSDFWNNVYLPTMVDKADREVIWHLFSLNGCRCFYQNWKFRMSPEQKHQIKGIICDSAPGRIDCDPRFYINARFFMWPRKERTNFHFYTQALPSQLPGALLMSVQNFFGLNPMFSPEFQKEDLPHNQLYITTQDDLLIKFKYTTEIVNAQLHKGKAVEFKYWPNGRHCAHVREKEREYLEVCRRFVSRALGREFGRPKARL